MNRRELVGGGLLGMTAMLGNGAEAAQEERGAETARAVDSVRILLQRHLEKPFAELAEIRQQQRIFLKASQGFPTSSKSGLTSGSVSTTGM